MTVGEPVTRPADEAWLDGLGACLVLAPHPDDETLGCGGLIAMLRRRGAPVSVVLVSDGTRSHPGSLRFPPAARRALRRAEMERALAILGVDRAGLHALDLPDGAVPDAHQPGHDAAVARIAAIASQARARTLLTPWRRDPHPDHRAVSAMARAARDVLGGAARVVEYAVWTDERGCAADRPRPGEVDERRLDVSSVLSLKRRAVAAHASQLGRVILDDPHGFTLPPSLLARCTGPIERYLLAPVAAPGAGGGDMTRERSLPSEYFDRVYAARADPWDFETSIYEAAKYAETLAALPRARYPRGLEIGCSIGV